MSDKKIKEELIRVEKEYKSFCENKDKQTLFYFEQMTDIFYNELLYEVSDKKVLNNLVYKVFRSNINIIFKNMQDYVKNVSFNSKKMIDEIINVSMYNKFVDYNNMNKLFNNFSVQVNKNFNLKEKIIVLISTNVNHFKGQLFSSFTFDDNEKISQIVLKYEELFRNEMINNVFSKRDYLISEYKIVIDGVLSELSVMKDEVREKNLKLITNVSYLYLKEKEYINMNKSLDLNIKLINDVFKDLDESFKKMGIVKTKNIKFNPLKDYLLSFNNTMGVKIKNFFDEINLVVTLDDKEINNKIKSVNDMITHVFEMNLVFDKKFVEFKRDFSVPTKEVNNFKSLVDSKNRAVTDGIRANLFNIFRDNVKIYNDVVYKTMLLKARVDDYNVVLSVDKVKDLLFK